MHNIMLFDADDRQFDVAMINRGFQSERGFRDVRRNPPCRRMIEADYAAGDDRTIIGLSGIEKRSPRAARRSLRFAPRY